MNFSRWKTTDSSTSNVLLLRQSVNTAELLAFASIRISWGVDLSRANPAWESDLSVMNWSPLSQSVSGQNRVLDWIESSDPQPP